MSTSQGLGRRRPPHFRFAPWQQLLDFGTLGEQGGRALAEELYFGGYPPPVVEIPLSWLTRPARYRWDSKINRAEVSQRSGATARSSSAALNERQRVFTASVDSVVTVDPGNLAKWVTDYYTSPLPRTAALIVQVTYRTQTEIWRILGVKQGTHIRITDAPATWPAGAVDLLVEGITHQVRSDGRYVIWNTSPIIGDVAGTAGPWAYYGVSTYSGTDARPF